VKLVQRAEGSSISRRLGSGDRGCAAMRPHPHAAPDNWPGYGRENPEAHAREAKPHPDADYAPSALGRDRSGRRTLVRPRPRIRVGSWNTKASERFAAPTFSNPRGHHKMRPSVGSIRLAISLSNVLLPQPDGREGEKLGRFDDRKIDRRQRTRAVGGRPCPRQDFHHGATGRFGHPLPPAGRGWG